MENVCLNNCVRFTKWIPVIFISCVIGWSYYAYIVQLCLLCIDQMSKKVIYIFLYHIFLIMFTWSYFQTIFTPIEKPTNEFYLRDTDIYQMEISENELAKKSVIDKKAKDLPLLTRTSTGGARYCDKCKCIKPDRSHHCGVCQTCVLKMDHHCPWVNNCVGYSNYKFFILFLFYAVLYCLYIFATSLEYFIKFWNEIQSFQAGKFHLLLLFFVAIMFGISIFTLLAYHIYLLSRNCTTLESFRAPIFISTGMSDKNGFNLSKLENCRQVFGNSLMKAFLPICTSNQNGFDYTQLARINLRLPNFDKKSKITIMGNGWGYSSTIFTRIDSICSNIDFPTIIKTHHRPQLQRNPFVDDSFLIASDDQKDPKFSKINDAISLNSIEHNAEKLQHLNTVHIINNKKRHSSITFASIFNQNQSLNNNLNQTDNNDTSRKIKTYETLDTSNNDGINFPTSIKQSLAASTQNYNANDSLLLNERQALNTSKKMMDQIRITME